MASASLCFEGCTSCCQPATGSQPATSSLCSRSSVHGWFMKAMAAKTWLSPWSNLFPHSPFTFWIGENCHTCSKNKLSPCELAKVPLSASMHPTMSGCLVTSFHLEDAGHDSGHHLIFCFSGPDESVHYLNSTALVPSFGIVHVFAESLSLQCVFSKKHKWVAGRHWAMAFPGLVGWAGHGKPLHTTWWSTQYER